MKNSGSLIRKIVLRSLMLSLALVTSVARAETSVIFSKDGSKASILMLARSHNPDSIAFFNALITPAQDNNGKLTKKFEIVGANGEKWIDVACAASKLVPDLASCAIVVFASPVSILDPNSGQVSMVVHGAQAQPINSQFVTRTSESQIFASSDGHLHLSGSAGEFRLLYQQ